MNKKQRQVPPSDFTSDVMSLSGIKLWAMREYRRLYCDGDKPIHPLNMDDFQRQLLAQRPEGSRAIGELRNELDIEISREICSQFAVDEEGHFKDQVDVVVTLHKLRTDLAERMVVGEVVDMIEKEKLCSIQQAPTAPTSALRPLASTTSLPVQERLELLEATPPNFTTAPATSHNVEAWVQAEYTRRYCDTSGNLIKAPNFFDLRIQLNHERFADNLEIDEAIKKLEWDLANKPLSAQDAAQIYMLAQTECDKYAWTDQNRSTVRGNVVSALLLKRPDIHLVKIEAAVKKAEESIQARTLQQATPLVMNQGGASAPKLSVQPDRQAAASSFIKDGFNLAADHGLKAWVYLQYAHFGFEVSGAFKGYPLLVARLDGLKFLRPGLEAHALEALSSIRKGRNRDFHFDVISDGRIIVAKGLEYFRQQAEGAVRAFRAVPLQTQRYGVGTASGSQSALQFTMTPTHNSLVPIQKPTMQSMNPVIPVSLSTTPRDDLLARKNVKVEDVEVQQAPLISASILAEDHGAILPQYGLLGSYGKEKIFLNTNVPFSAFICGVQGSGKSHTTSCILENALIPSSQLGTLQKPLSALVFSYGPFNGDGSGYSISEAAFLAAPHVNFPSHPHVGKIRVLVSPSNYFKLARLYLRVPNVTVTKFKLKPANLDIDIMLTLMNINETTETPLYMAAVTQLLRQMATEGGSFSYFTFKARLKSCKFNPVQVNMLRIRLGLLESFLDLDNSCPEPEFAEGEVTIIDLSCPFVDANTACVLFRIGLQRYLQSRVAGKMVVLDEAHKYMLPNPGAKALNETLRTVIRMQRHYGVRVVVSTQEPTLLTNLIALCSVTVVHQFSSPEWFASIKRHIPMQGNEFDVVMRAIESLKTGTALVYSPNSALGRDEAGNLVKGSGKFMKLNIRKRVTSDGGQGVLAV